MTIGNPIRLDRLQRALVYLFGSAGGLTDYQVAWAYGQGVYANTFPRGFVNLTMASGPSIAAPPGRGTCVGVEPDRLARSSAGAPHLHSARVVSQRPCASLA